MHAKPAAELTARGGMRGRAAVAVGRHAESMDEPMVGGRKIRRRHWVRRGPPLDAHEGDVDAYHARLARMMRYSHASERICSYTVDPGTAKKLSMAASAPP